MAKAERKLAAAAAGGDGGSAAAAQASAAALGIEEEEEEDAALVKDSFVTIKVTANAEGNAEFVAAQITKRCLRMCVGVVAAFAPASAPALFLPAPCERNMRLTPCLLLPSSSFFLPLVFLLFSLPTSAHLQVPRRRLLRRSLALRRRDQRDVHSARERPPHRGGGVRLPDRECSDRHARRHLRSRRARRGKRATPPLPATQPLYVERRDPIERGAARALRIAVESVELRIAHRRSTRPSLSLRARPPGRDRRRVRLRHGRRCATWRGVPNDDQIDGRPHELISYLGTCSALS